MSPVVNSSPPGGRAVESPPSMRDRIVAGAATALSALPLRKVTMDDIARSAGIARQTIYKHFANRDEIVIALFIDEVRTVHAPELARLHAERRDADQLVTMFLAQLTLASRWTLIDQTFDPDAGPEVVEMVLSSEAMARCNADLWRPILDDHIGAGVVRADLDVERTIRWMTFQSSFLLSHPGSLTHDDRELRAYVRAFIVDAWVEPEYRSIEAFGGPEPTG